MLPPVEIIELARIMGDPAHDLCIEAEGNVSCIGPDGVLWIKGSGKAMRNISADGFACCSMAPVLAAVRAESPVSETQAREILNASKLDRGPASPSTETYMHALILSVPDTKFVAHGHPTPLLSVLCHPKAPEWASKRLFPDEIVLLGPATCFVPYVAPGLPLAMAIDRASQDFRTAHGIEPKTFWLQNHGLIVTGRTAREVTSALLMAVKAARVLLGLLQTGAEPRWLSEAEVDQIYNWPDEHARQRALWGA